MLQKSLGTDIGVAQDDIAHRAAEESGFASRQAYYAVKSRLGD